MPAIDLQERMGLILQRINEGRDSYAGRQDAWHGAGEVTGTWQTWREMQAAAKANFLVEKLQLEFRGVKIDAWGTFRLDDNVPKGLERQVQPITLADGKVIYVTFLAQVSKDYQVIQHTDGFELLDHLVGSIDGAHYETMGTLDFGRAVWGQLNPKLSIRVGDDISDVYVSFLTSHDRSRSFDIYETLKRQVCRNTVRAGSLSRLGDSLKVQHRKGAEKRISELKAEMDEIKNVALSMQDRLTYLAHRKVTKDNLSTIMNRLFPPTKNDDGVEESSSRRDNILAKVLAEYESNDHNAFPEQRGTAYNLFNAVTNYVDHSRGSAEGRAKSALFGSGDALKTSALEVILAEAEGMPAMMVRPSTGSTEGDEMDWASLGFNLSAGNTQARKN
jgi:phage/plasmid-like protein (TIGR03299 family)